MEGTDEKIEVWFRLAIKVETDSAPFLFGPSEVLGAGDSERALRMMKVGDTNWELRVLVPVGPIRYRYLVKHSISGDVIKTEDRVRQLVATRHSLKDWAICASIEDTWGVSRTQSRKSLLLQSADSSVIRKTRENQSLRKDNAALVKSLFKRDETIAALKAAKEDQLTFSDLEKLDQKEKIIKALSDELSTSKAEILDLSLSLSKYQHRVEEMQLEAAEARSRQVEFDRAKSSLKAIGESVHKGGAYFQQLGLENETLKAQLKQAQDALVEERSAFEHQLEEEKSIVSELKHQLQVKEQELSMTTLEEPPPILSPTVASPQMSLASSRGNSSAGTSNRRRRSILSPQRTHSGLPLLRRQLTQLAASYEQLRVEVLKEMGELRIDSTDLLRRCGNRLLSVRPAKADEPAEALAIAIESTESRVAEIVADVKRALG